jgi:hypothetical protein
VTAIDPPPSGRPLRNAFVVLLIGGVVTLSCSPSDDTIYRPPPTGALQGAVKLVSNLSDDLGAVIGTEIVSDAAGVKVWLTRPDSTADSTTTTAGNYGFTASAAGEYRARCQPFAELLVSSPLATLAAGGTATFDTLELGPAGDIRTYPNPFPDAGLAIEFDTATVDSIEVVAYALTGEIAWRYKYEGVIGLNHIHWVGIDNDAVEVPDGWYWIVVRYAGTTLYNLTKKL